MKFLNKKKFKYGGYAFLLTVIVIVIAYVFNMFTEYLDDRFDLSLDLTENRIYSLTSQTEHILDELSQDIYIYTLYQKGQENNTVVELLEKYSTGSKYVHVENIDMVSQPGKVLYYEQVKDISLSQSSIIVTNSADTTNTKQSFKVLDYLDLYGYDSDTQQLTLFKGESAVSGAINYVLNPDIPKVWFLEGHGTTSSEWSAISSYLEDENYDTEGISLLTEAENLEKGDILMIVAPSIDLSNDEREILLDFALDGGKTMILFSPLSSTELPNLMLVLSHLNISLKDGIVIEGGTNTGNYYSYPNYLIPNKKSHSIMSPLIASDMAVIVPDAGALKLGPELSGVTIETLLETTKDSYLELYTNDMDGIKDENAEEGPFTIAVAVTKNATSDTEEAKLVITTNAIMFQAANQMVTQGNYEMLVNAVSWLSPYEDDFYIRGKSLQTSSLYFNSTSQIRWTIGIIVIIPLLAFGAALFVYLKRRHL
jgi:ABC-2 type transport system permease protein